MTTGTAAYLSPEQARGGDVGPATDVYSLGLVLLQCFTRRREFPGSLVESAIARLTRDPVVPEPLPEHWKHVLRAMTAQDPTARPLGAQLVTMLRDVVIAETATAQPEQRPRRRHPGSRPGSAEPARASAPAAADARPATLDSLPEESLQRTVAMAARLFDAPIALVDVLDDDREWTQSWIAEGVDEAARNITFRNGFAPVPVPVVIPDGAAHPEMRQSPLVTGPLGLRFYVSVPLLRHDGTAVGTLAVLDTRPREATEADLANLRDLAALAVTQLELRRESLRTTSDALRCSSPAPDGHHRSAAADRHAWSRTVTPRRGPSPEGPHQGCVGLHHDGGVPRQRRPDRRVLRDPHEPRVRVAQGLEPHRRTRP